MPEVDWDVAAAIGVIIGAFATSLGVIVTSVLNIRSNRLTRERLELDQLIAENSAARSEAAAGLTEEYTRRMVDALEEIAAQGVGRAVGPTPRVRWELVHHTGDRYRLTNIGDLEALDVRVEAHESLGISNVEGDPDLGPGEALTFVAAKTMGTTDSTVTVRWNQVGVTDELMWRYPLPGRPPGR